MTERKYKNSRHGSPANSRKNEIIERYKAYENIKLLRKRGKLGSIL